MAEITKVSTPLVIRENTGGRNKITGDQAFELTDTSKIHKPLSESKIHEQKSGHLLQDGVGREMAAPLLKPIGELAQAFSKLDVLLKMGISVSEAVQNAEIRALLESAFLSPEQLVQALKEQDASAVLFKHVAFDPLRDLAVRFDGNVNITSALAHLLKVFEQNVNTENSIKTILLTCQNLLDYMFSKDRAQFSEYLQGLEEMLLPQNGNGKLGVEHREASQILKGNMLPLLGEIVVKYNQNEKIRDMVMVVVHNIVRVDQGTPEMLMEALSKLISELKLAANLPEGYEMNLMNAVLNAAQQVKDVQNSTLSKIIASIAETLSSQNVNAATLRQAESVLLGLIQNQSSMMDLLHFVLPIQTEHANMIAELYVDPDSDERVGRSNEQSRKLFLCFESENLGAFEISILHSGERVELQIWCPDVLVKSLATIKRPIADIIMAHGYTMKNYKVSELTQPHSIAEVFPKLLDRRIGIDVRI